MPHVKGLLVRLLITRSWTNWTVSDLESVKSFADDFIQKNLKLHVMINNAGVMAPPLSLTKQVSRRFHILHMGCTRIERLAMLVNASILPSIAKPHLTGPMWCSHAGARAAVCYEPSRSFPVDETPAARDD
eukprot:8987396-Pyramimonas_sp.AAC.1